MHRRLAVPVAAALLVLGSALPAAAHAPSGAIFTTLADGTEVNLNNFPSKDAVYLDGGPGAPQTAAGLDDGTYVFMVTDPSGKTLLSQDAAQCRQFTVAGGVITGVVANGCQHVVGADIDHGATTVQLMPYKNTPNHGGVYKVWAMETAHYPAQCPLTTEDPCIVAGTKHGFTPAYSKTDNFKVRERKNVREIDVRFFRDLNGDGHYQAGSEPEIAHTLAIWTDTNGVSNKKYSDPNFAFGTRAHVEVPETDGGGVHYITLMSQPGCVNVGLVHINDFDHTLDAQGRLAVDVAQDINYNVDVACTG